ncbi:MAG: T9SS type A sorting domain-containing protein [Bacteroidetes bacterium]|nr:T9SS type A sorting domain-containing protein [Bacteroidota bacterium]
MEARFRYAVRLVATLVLSGLSTSSAFAQPGYELWPQRIANFSFGGDVAIEGTTAVILGGAPVRHPVFNSDVGSIDIYRFDGSDWVFSQNVISNDPIYWNKIGGSVDLSGGLIAIGTPATAKGAALLFNYDGSEWIEDVRLASNAPQSFPDQFGNNVSLSGDLMVAGDTDHQNPFDPQALNQFAFVFRWNGSSWSLEDSLSAADATSGTAFGTSVDVAPDVIVVGDPLFSISAGTSREGAAYVYEFDGSAWTQAQQLSAGTDQIVDARFGTSVATDGNTIVVGAVRDSVGGAVHAGAAYVFRNVSGTWTLTQRLAPSVPDEYANFGASVSVSGDYLIVGSPADTRFPNSGGSAYFYRFDGNSWVLRTRLALPDGVQNDRYGADVDVDADWAIVGAPGRSSGQWSPGATYIYATPTLVATEDEADVERTVSLSAYPNPFSDRATINFDLPQTEYVNVGVYDVLGRRVVSIIDARLAAGKHEYAFSATDLADGVYLIRMRAEAGLVTKTVVLLR